MQKKGIPQSAGIYYAKSVFKRVAVHTLTFLLVGGCLLFATPAFAKDGPGFRLTNVIEKEVRVQKDGKWLTERVSAERAQPGDVLVYSVNYENTGSEPAVGASIVDPIPAEVVYLLDTAEGKDAEISCSIDGSKTWQPQPAVVLEKRPDGTVETKKVAPESYTHLRWVFKKPIQPGQTGQVNFKVTVK